MIQKMKTKITAISFYEEKKRFFVFAFLLLFCLFIAYYLFQYAYASYETTAKLNANIDRALYILDTNKMSFNIDSSQIIPSTTPYVYKFSVSNFNTNDMSDLDIEYQLQILTTTNLPLVFQLYRNENYDNPDSVNLLSGGKTIQDKDSSWYSLYQPSGKYMMSYSKKTTDIYTLVIFFPKNYSENLEYADGIENIEVIIQSKQVIE